MNLIVGQKYAYLGQFVKVLEIYGEGEYRQAPDPDYPCVKCSDASGPAPFSRVPL
jgi:hypothetical protein